MRYLLTLLLSCGIFVFAFSQTTESVSVFFEHDQAELTPEATTSLQNVVGHLLIVPDYGINLHAYTDNTGTDAYNQQLANARANAVRQYLAGQGVVTEKMAVSSWGEQRQSFSNNSEETRQKNRRVDLELTIWSINSPEDFQKRLQAKSDLVYTAQNTVEETIKTPAGAIVVIPPGSFVFEDGSEPTSSVEITIKEALKPGDWLINGLATSSNGQLLQSGGMLFIGATSGGRELQMADGAEITVALPAIKDVDPEMQLFYGQHNAANNTVTNWQQANGGARFRQTVENPAPVHTLTPELCAQLKQLKVTVSPAPQMPVYPALTQPKKPIEPSKPRLRAAPEWAQVAKSFSLDGNPKGKKLKKAKQEFAARQHYFAEDSIQYEAAMQVYRSKRQKYETQLAAYTEAREAWEKCVNERLLTTRKYFLEEKVNKYATVLNKVLKNTGNKKPFKYRTLNDAIINRVEKIVSYRAFNQNYYGSQDPDAPIYKQLFGADAVKYDAELRQRIKNYGSSTGCDFKYTYADSSYVLFKKLLQSCGLTAISDSLSTVHREKEVLTGTGNVQKQAMASYVTEITQLGWINVDKFSKDPSPRVVLSFEAKDAFAMYAYLPSLNSMLMLTKNEETGVFSVEGVPEGQRVQLMTLKTDNGQLWVNQQQITAGKNVTTAFDYTAYSMHSFRKELDQLN